MAPARAATRLSSAAAVLLALGVAAQPKTPPPPFGAIRELVVLDCNGGLHVLPGTPLEVNVNLRGARHLVN